MGRYLGYDAPVPAYDTSSYRKHKRPKGWGSLCPEHVSQEAAQDLLDSGVTLNGTIYNVSDRHAFQAFAHRPDTYHGHPIPWSRLPHLAVEQLIRAGRLDMETYRKAIRQQWGREPD